LSYISIFGKEEARRFLTIADGIRPDLDIRIIINFFKTIYTKNVKIVVYARTGSLETGCLSLTVFLRLDIN